MADTAHVNNITERGLQSQSGNCVKAINSKSRQAKYSKWDGIAI